MSALAQTISTLKKIFAPALLTCHVSHHAGMSRLGPQPGQWNGQPLAQPRGQPPFGGTNQGPEVLFFVDAKTACIKGCFPFLTEIRRWHLHFKRRSCLCFPGRHGIHRHHLHLVFQKMGGWFFPNMPWSGRFWSCSNLPRIEITSHAQKLEHLGFCSNIWDFVQTMFGDLFAHISNAV